MKVVVDLAHFYNEFRQFFIDSDADTLMNCIRTYMEAQPEYTETPHPSVKRAEKHSKFTGFKSAYWTYMEHFLQRRADFSKTEGAAMNKIIDRLLILTDNNQDNALVIWCDILKTMPYLGNEFLLGQTVRLTSFNYYLDEIIIKVNKFNNDRIRQQSNSGNDTAKPNPNARHSKYAKPQL